MNAFIMVWLLKSKRNITGLEIWVNAVTRIKQRSFDWKLSENFKKQQFYRAVWREKKSPNSYNLLG